MKKLLTILSCLSLIATQTTAQNDAISKFFSQYENREDITTVSLSGKIFEMAQEIKVDGESEQKVQKLASQITGLRMIVDDQDKDAKSTAKKALQAVGSNFEELVTIRDKKALVNVMVQEVGGIVSEVLVIVGTEAEFILVSLVGNMRLSDVGELTNQISSAGKDIFSNTALDPSKMKIYPNPVSQGEPVNISLPDELEGADVRIFDASGKEVGAYKASGKLKKYDTSKIGKGVYVLKATKGELETTKKFIVQ